MKKLFTLILALFMLCSCSVNQPIEEPQSESSQIEEESKPEDNSESEISSEQEEPKMVIYQGENGKLGLKYQYGEIVLEACYDGIKEYNYRDVVSYIANINDVPMRRIVYDENGEPYVEEILSPRYYFLDAEGNSLIDVPLEYYYVADSDNVSIRCAADGKSYDYLIEDGKLVLLEYDDPFTGEMENGFTHIRCLYSNEGAFFVRYGVEKNGETVYDNIYTEIIQYFGDRFRLKMVCRGGYYKTLLGDENGNIICDKFQTLGWCPVNEEKCIGTASVGKSEWEEYAPTFDESGEPMPDGMWFIDKYGNIISERFEYIELIFDENAKIIRGEKKWCATAAKVTYENGETEIIDISEYAFDY
ncbi:MAG: hypothetical protein IJ306_04410 [Oscillospiraceae bacterium]|nr:hypothetical protein [Oscillospiraceae bacterium]